MISAPLQVKRGQIQSQLGGEFEEPVSQLIVHHVLLRVQLGFTAHKSPQNGVQTTCGIQENIEVSGWIHHFCCKGQQVNKLGRAFMDDSPRGEEGFVQQDRGKLPVLPVVLIKARNDRLNHQMGKTVHGCRKDIGDAGVHSFIITRVGGQLPGDEVRTNNMEQVVSECENLEDRKAL